MFPLHLRSLCRFAAATTLTLVTAGSLAAQWKTNPVVSWEYDQPAHDFCRLEFGGWAFTLTGGVAGLYVDRVDWKGNTAASRVVSDPQYPEVLGPWWKQDRMSDCASCKTGPREFFVAYNVHVYNGGLTPNPDVIRVARVFWNPNTDQLDVMPGFPKTLQVGIASHLAIATSTNAGAVDGAIVAWQVTDKSTGAEHVFQQGVNLAGGLFWTGFPSGVPIDPADLGTAAGGYEPPSVVSADDGEAIVTYHKKQGGIAQHWTTKLVRSSAASTSYRFGPLIVPGQHQGSTQTESVTRCCVASDGGGGAVYGLAANWSNTQLLAAHVTSTGTTSMLTLWSSAQGGGQGGHDDHLRALSMLALPNKHALLTYRDHQPNTNNSGIRCIEVNASSGLSMGWTRFVRGASIAPDEDDDAASVLLDSTACIVSTSDADVLAIAFNTSGTQLWNGNSVLVNDQNATPSKQYGAYRPRWPHVMARSDFTKGYMIAWYDDDDYADAYPGAMIAERLNTKGKPGVMFSSGYSWGSPNGPNTAVAFDLSLTEPMRFEQFELCFGEAQGATGTLEVYAATGQSYVGIETNPSAWTLVGSGNVIEAAYGTPTTVTLSAPFVLPAGTSAVLLRGISVSLDATPVAPANLVLDAGALVVHCGALVTQWPNGSVLGNRVLQGGFSFEAASVPQNPGAVTSYGAGCYSRTDSFYSQFGDAATASAALSGHSLRFAFAGDQYAVHWGIGNFVLPSPAAVPLSGFLPNADDGAVAIALPQPMPFPGGVTTSLYVHSNGSVWFDDNSSSLTPNDYTPTPAAMLAAPGTGFWSWHDFNPAEPGSGQITYDVQGDLVLVTWMGVESYPAGVANPSTLQFQFDLVSGGVRMVWPSLDADSASPYGSGYLVGYSPGGPSVDAGSIDLSSLANTPTGVGMFPLHLDATVPVAGTTLTLTTENMPEAAPGSGLYLGLVILSTTQMPGPGIDLGFLGAPGCSLGVGSFDLMLTMIGTSPTLSVSISIPNGVPAGTTLYAQSAALTAAGLLNAAGITTSNGLQLRVGS